MLLSLATVSLVGNVKVEDAKSYPLTTCVVSGEALDSMGKPMVFVYEERHDKNNLYSVHAPEVEYIAKGKIHQRYEFGVKASIATTSKGGWHLGAMSCPGTPPTTATP